MIDYPKYKKVLFCTDFSENSDCAFAYAFGIAKRDEGMLYIYHVVPTYSQHNLERHLSADQLARLLASAAEHRDRTVNEKYLNVIKDKSKVNVITETGREDEKIIDFVRKESIDIIVIGTHGRTGLEHVFLGSVAEKVVRRSPVPVLVIPYRDKPASA